MDILGVTPVEVIIIVILGLIVFGPERLPEIGRWVGRMFARLLAWQQQSPEAQMIQQIRQDFDREILELRDEIVRARQQVDISAETRQLYTETQELLSPGKMTSKGLSVRPANGSRSVHQPVDAQAVASGVEAPPAPSRREPPVSVTDQAVDRVSVPQADRPVAPPQDESATTQTLLRRLEVLHADMQALRMQLRAHGVLDPDWQFPSQSADTPLPQLEKEVGT